MRLTSVQAPGCGLPRSAAALKPLVGQLSSAGASSAHRLLLHLLELLLRDLLAWEARSASTSAGVGSTAGPAGGGGRRRERALVGRRLAPEDLSKA